MLAACAWCVALYLARWWQTGSTYFFYLVYNLGLALIPLVLSTVVTRWQGLGKGRYLIGLAWLLFFPNAPYLVTDLIHLRPRREAPFWFDWLMLVSFSGAGLLIAFVSLGQVHGALARRWSSRITVAVIWVVLGLTAFGIYLGRFPRWNSWDVVTRPGDLLADLVDRLVFPWHHPAMMAYCFGVTVLLGVGYFTPAWLVAMRVPPRDRVQAATRPETGRRGFTGV